MRARAAIVLVLAVLIGVVALPVLAHNGYINCSTGYNPVTSSVSYDTNGTHTHQIHGIVSQWITNNNVWNNLWNDDGFWSANAPGNHNGWVSCL